MTVELHIEGRRRVAQPIKRELVMITREALTNVVKHSRASRVQVRLSFLNGSVRLRVEDNGVGFDFAQARRSAQGLGLKNIRRRTESAGGRLDIDSGAGKGTAMVVEMPLKPHHG